MDASPSDGRGGTPGWMTGGSAWLAVGPLGVAVAALALAQLPEKEVHVHLDLKAAALLAATVLLAAHWWALVLARHLQPRAGTGTPELPQAAAEGAAKAEEEEKQEAREEPEGGASKAPTTKELHQMLLAWRSSGSDVEAERQASETKAIEQLYTAMAGASPAIVHRIPASAVESTTSHWSSPLFAACGRLWSLRMGPLGSSAPETRYFCLLPHGHIDRLRCSFLFAGRPGDGYKERRVHDWPVELAGHPWGPTLTGEELAQHRQADGSVLLMIHAVGLGSETDPVPPEGPGQFPPGCRPEESPKMLG